MDQPIEVSEPLSPAQLAALTAKRAAQSDPKSNLLPQEFLTRYQQQFHDRLWMRGLLALGGVYLVGLMIYLVALAVFDFRAGGVEKQAKALSGSYTNAIQLKAKYEVLKDRQELKFAALDCWRATAELMPESLSLDSMNFSDGRKLMLAGTAPGDQIGAVIDFNSGMRKYSVNGQQLFDPGKGTPLATRMLNPNTASWNFTLELKRTEVQ
jgi:hypothetical protein